MIAEILVLIFAFIGGFFIFKVGDLKKEIKNQKDRAKGIQKEIQSVKDSNEEISKKTPADNREYFARNWLRNKEDREPPT